ncbi:MAG: dTDP-4-dehydrorhamnose reductase [Bacteroidales bacterium]|nr:dTDP-4-dehydrorhamnose reductase [Bacteroidales bacterium]
MTKILITGSNGQLGSAIRDLAADYPQFSFTGIDIHDLDLTNEIGVRQFLNQHAFSWIINCAAFTAVDLAESQPEKAYAVNSGVPRLLGKICIENNTRLIHISTDYVYNGKQWTPHTEDESTAPVSVYAKSKAEGEMVLRDNPMALIIRTSWLYYKTGNNFLRTMIRLSTEKKEIGVVTDQTGTPTYAADLADAVLKIIDFSENNGFVPGIYNYSNEGVCSWYDFAIEIMQHTGSNCRVNPIRTPEYPLPAHRPEYSVLEKKKIKTAFGLAIPYWRNSLLKAMQEITLKK